MVVCTALATLDTHSYLQVTPMPREIYKSAPRPWKFNPTGHTPHLKVVQIFILSCLIVSILLWEEQTIDNIASILKIVQSKTSTSNV